LRIQAKKLKVAVIVHIGNPSSWPLLQLPRAGVVREDERLLYISRRLNVVDSVFFRLEDGDAFKVIVIVLVALGWVDLCELRVEGWLRVCAGCGYSEG